MQHTQDESVAWTDPALNIREPTQHPILLPWALNLAMAYMYWLPLIVSIPHTRAQLWPTCIGCLHQLAYHTLYGTPDLTCAACEVTNPDGGVYVYALGSECKCAYADIPPHVRAEGTGVAGEVLNLSRLEYGMSIRWLKCT